MPNRSIPANHQRFLKDMRIYGFSQNTQGMYLRAMPDFTRFLGRSPHTALPEDLRAFQLEMMDKGVGAPTFNNRLSFFSVTCAREGLKKYLRYQRTARKIPDL